MTAEHDEKGRHQKRPWPYQALAVTYVVSLILAGLSLPSLDGVPANLYRFGLYAGASVVFWMRILVSRARKETGRGYCFYVLLVLAMPFLAWPLQDWLW